jgi:hypothetical protein
MFSRNVKYLQKQLQKLKDDAVYVGATQMEDALDFEETAATYVTKANKARKNSKFAWNLVEQLEALNLQVEEEENNDND